jgi:hypothetical protein
MNNRTALIFKLKCLIKKCREYGKFTLAIILKDKVEKL